MIRWRWVFFAISMLVLALAWPASQRLQLDRSLVRMFSPNDPIRKDFEVLQEQFGVSDLVVFAYRDPELWNADGSGIERLKAIRQKVEAVPGVAIAMDLSKVDAMLAQLETPISLFGSLGKPAGHPLLDPTSELATKFRSIFEGQTHSRDSDLVAIACLLAPSGQLGASTSKTLVELRALGNSLPQAFGVSAALQVGQPVMVEEGFEAIELDGKRLGIFSAISLASLILIGFRSVRWAIITIVVVQWSLIVTRGLLVWLAWDLTMVSSMLSSIVTVISVATTMHWMVGYRHAMESNLSPEQALRQSMRELWRPIVWACITDAIGFAALMIAKVGPVQDYGCMMALASLVVMVGIFVLVPTMALVPLAPAFIAKPLGLSFELYPIPGDEQVRRLLRSLLAWSLRWPRSIVCAGLILAGLAIWGSLRLQVETDFIKNFKQDAPLVVAYQAVETELGGAGVWDVVLPAPKVLSQKYLDEVLALERRLLAIEVPGDSPLRLSHAMSFADADAAATSLPKLRALPIEARLFGMRQVMGEFVDTLITKQKGDERSLRIMLRSHEQSESVQKEQLIAQVRTAVDETMRSESWRTTLKGEAIATVSGYYVLLTELVSSVVADQWRCFALAALGIGIAMAIALRSPWFALLSILPNALPSFCILGWMGWMGVRVNLGAAMIAAVSMGLSVDSSLHYLMRFQRERSLGKTIIDALESAQSEIGMAMFLSSLALVVGFGSLATSDFLPTVVFGTTAAISILGGLLGNLFILPSLLAVGGGRERFDEYYLPRGMEQPGSSRGS